MDTRLVLAWLHLLALGIGLGAVWSRARALRSARRDPDDHGAVRRALTADAWWGIAAATWVVTGLWRLLAGTEKAAGWYFGNRAFVIKMALFLGIVLLEVWPMMTLMRWRRNRDLRTSHGAGRMAAISYLQCAMVIAMVLAASAMARGYGSGARPAGRETGNVQQPGVVQQPGSVGFDSTGGAAQPGIPPGDTSRAAALLPPVPAVEPTGVETVTAGDLALLASELGMPLDGMNPLAMASSYDDARGGGSRRHEALDIMAARGTPVRSAAKGRVLKLFNSVAGGLMVYAADSSERFILMYAHLDAYAPGLRDGAPLARGQVIGTVGSSGNASPTAPHLHLAISRSADVTAWSKGMPIDPLPVLQAAAGRRP